MLYIKKRKDYWSDYFYVEILSSEDMIKRWDVYIWQWHALQIIDTDWSLAIISWIRWCELNWVDWHDTLPWTKFTNNPVKSTDSTHMPRSIWLDCQWKIQTTVTRHPDDPRKIISLHTKFLPPMNAYSTLVTKIENTSAATKKAKIADLIVLPYEVRIARSEENVRAEILRLIPEDMDVDDLNIFISRIF